MGEIYLTIDELEKEIKSGKNFILIHPFLDSKSNILIGTQKVLTEKDILRIKERCPEKLHNKVHVKTVIPHYIEEDKRIKWVAYLISLFENNSLFNGLSRQKKDFVVKYLKSILIDYDYPIWKLSQLKNHSKKVFDHTINTCFISLLIYFTYSSIKLSGMIDATFIDKIILVSLLHDIGFLKFDKNVIEKKRIEIASTPNSNFYLHAVESKNLIESERNRHDLSDDIIQAILSHEEYLDGTGAPRGLNEKDLSFLAKLISISNYFELLINGEYSLKPRPYRDYIQKLKIEKTKFDQDLIESTDLCFKYLYQI